MNIQLKKTWFWDGGTIKGSVIMVISFVSPSFNMILSFYQRCYNPFTTKEVSVQIKGCSSVFNEDRITSPYNCHLNEV